MFKEWIKEGSGVNEPGNVWRAGKVWWLVLLISVNTSPLLLAEELRRPERGDSGQKSSPMQSEEYRIGMMVKAVAQAIQHPEKAESMQILVRYGTDSRYYVMIRGWLVQELKGAESLMQAQKEAAKKAHFRVKVDLLRRAIKRIDLE